MAQATEITITVRRNFTTLGETTGVQLATTFKLQKGDTDLAGLVQAKFREVQNALVQTLDSEPPTRTDTGTKLEPDAKGEEADLHPTTAQHETETDHSIPDDGTSLRPEPEPSGFGDEPPAAPVAELGPPSIGIALPSSANPDEEASAPNEEPVEPVDQARATPAQQRTIASLAVAAGWDATRLRTALESGFNRKAVADLGKREAASLILQLSQKQRGQIIGTRPDADSVPAPGNNEKENHPSNGTRP